MFTGGPGYPAPAPPFTSEAESSSPQMTSTPLSPQRLTCQLPHTRNTQIEELDCLYNKIPPQSNNLEVLGAHCKEISPKKARLPRRKVKSPVALNIYMSPT